MFNYSFADKKDRKEKGFTLIEILIIVLIIGILVSVILVSLLNSRRKAENNSAFTTFKSLATSSFLCITGQSNLETTYIFGNTICLNPGTNGNATWPNFTQYGWENEVFWCEIGLPMNIVPPTYSYGYHNGDYYGANTSSGQICLLMEKSDGKIMWCTERGCAKKGF